jgi:hypothetical protein
MTIEVKLRRSNKPDKKYKVTIGNKTIHFGARGMSDYTKHHDDDRMKRYLKRHRKRERWGKNGLKTVGWRSRWLLWNKKGIQSSRHDISKKFNVKFI